MLYLDWNQTISQLNNLYGILVIFMLGTLLFLKKIGIWCTDGIYSQNYVLDFALFWVFTSTEYHSPMKGKYPTYYVSS